MLLSSSSLALFNTLQISKRTTHVTISESISNLFTQIKNRMNKEEKEQFFDHYLLINTNLTKQAEIFRKTCAIKALCNLLTHSNTNITHLTDLNKQYFDNHIQLIFTQAARVNIIHDDAQCILRHSTASAHISELIIMLDHAMSCINDGITEQIKSKDNNKVIKHNLQSKQVMHKLIWSTYTKSVHNKHIIQLAHLSDFERTLNKISTSLAFC